MFLILDALASGRGRRLSSLDVIGVGPRVIAGILESFGIDYKILRIEEFLSRKRHPSDFDVMLVSAMSMDEKAVSKASRMFGGIKILGGPITADLSVVSRLGFHLGVWGEGELSFSLLLDKGLKGCSLPSPKDLKDVPNIVFQNGTHTNLAYLRKEDFLRFSPSIEAVKFYKKVPHYKSARVYVEVVRGCSNYNRPKINASQDICAICNACYEFNLKKRLTCPQGIPPGCGYCSIPYLYGPPKSRRCDDILREMDGLASLGVKRIVLSGADFLEYCREDLVNGPLTHPFNPGPNLEALEDLLSAVKSLSDERGLFVEIENAKPCLVDEEVAFLLGKYLRGSPVHIGVETGNKRHADLIGRPCSPDKSVRAIKLLKEAGLRPYAYFIHSLPGQNRTVARETTRTMRRAFDLGAEKITVYKFRSLPGTAFERYSAKVDKYSRMIIEVAIELNLRRKKELIGKVISAVVAPSIKRGVYAYPLGGGPVIRIRTKRKLESGNLIKVKVARVVYDRLVEGILVEESESS